MPPASLASREVLGRVGLYSSPLTEKNKTHNKLQPKTNKQTRNITVPRRGIPAAHPRTAGRCPSVHPRDALPPSATPRALRPAAATRAEHTRAPSRRLARRPSPDRRGLPAALPARPGRTRSSPPRRRGRAPDCGPELLSRHTARRSEAKRGEAKERPAMAAGRQASQRTPLCPSHLHTRPEPTPATGPGQPALSAAHARRGAPEQERPGRGCRAPPQEPAACAGAVRGCALSPEVWP